RYVALSVAAPGQARGEWTVAIGRHHKPNLRAVDGPDAKAARSRFSVVEVLPSGAAMLALAPETGRTHQLRLHASHAGAPLLGDKDYGGPALLVLANGRVISLARIALHCLRVTLPVRSGGKARVVAPVGGDLRAIWEALGGAP